MTIRAVLFDLDGTLVDSLEDLTDAVNHMLAGFGKKALDATSVRHLVGKGVRNLVQRALATGSADEIELGLALFVAYNTAHIADKSRLYPGVLAVLESLAANCIRMAIISNKGEVLSRLIMETLKIDGFFKQICGGDTFPEMKPSPLPLLEVTKRLGINPDEALMVGDSINDIAAAVSAGITAVGCAWGYGDISELEGAEYVIGEIGELCGIVRNEA